MKKLLPMYMTIAMLTAVPFHAATSGSLDEQMAPSLMLYIAIPLDGTPRQKDEAMRFGMRFDHARASSMDISRDRVNEPIEYTFSSPALLNFNVNGNRLPMLKIGGISALTYGIVSNVAGGAEVAATGVNWTYVGYGVVSAFIVDMELEDDKPAPEPDPCRKYTLNAADC